MTEPESDTAEPGSQANSIKRRLLGAAVLIALAVIFLPLLLDGSGSESRFRRVENVREHPPRIIGADGVPETRQIDAGRPRPSKPAPPAVIETRERPVVASDSKKPPAVADVAKPARVVEAATAAPRQPVSRNNPSAAIDEALVKLGEREAGVPQFGAANQVPSQATAAGAAGNNTTQQIAWVIQAGSFAEEGNALRLRDQLRSRGYPSFVSTRAEVQGDGSAIYRVKVGPVADRQKVERQKREIERITGRSSLLREYR